MHARKRPQIDNVRAIIVTMKGIIYTRVSSDEQVKGTSLEFQEELCRKYCEQKGIEIVEVFREEGESAKDLSLNNRRKFLEALEFCRKRKNQIQAFIILRVDRFARNTEDHFAVRKILLEYGTTLHSVTEPIGNKPAEKFIETVLAGAAEYDNAIRKQRCTDGMLARINQGIYPWKPPIGYTCLNARKRGEKKTQPDPPDEKRFHLIQQALKKYATGLYTQTQIMHLLNSSGLKTMREKKITLQLVDRMLGKNLHFYAGLILNPWTGNEIDGLHKAMISKDEMHQIRLLKSGKSIHVPLKRLRLNPLFPLRNIVKCSYCKRGFTGSESRGRSKKYPYYHCHNKGCKMIGKTVPKQKLEDDFLLYLNRITPKEDFLKAFKETVLVIWNEGNLKHSQMIKRYEQQLKELEGKKNRIFEMREEGSYTKEEFIERKENIENEITTLKISLSESRIDQLDIEAVSVYASNFIKDLARQWFDLIPRFQIRFQQLIFPEGISYDRNSGFRTAKLGHIFKLNQGFDGQKSHLVHLVRDNWNLIIADLKLIEKIRIDMDVEKEKQNQFILAA